MGGFSGLSSSGSSAYGSAFSGTGGSVAGTQDTGAFGNALYNRKDPRRKEQFIGDIASVGGIGALQAGGSLLAQPAKYYSDILSGDRQKMLEAQAPEVSNIMSGYNAARKAGSEFTPRGGGRVQSLEEAPYKEAGDVTRLLEQSRPGAAQALTQISGLLSDLGISELGIGTQELARAASEKDYQEAVRYSHGIATAKMVLGGLVGGLTGAAGGGGAGGFLGGALGGVNQSLGN